MLDGAPPSFCELTAWPAGPVRLTEDATSDNGPVRARATITLCSQLVKEPASKIARALLRSFARVSGSQNAQYLLNAVENDGEVAFLC